ncbi:Uncharacterised protein [Mycobacteroides abscessus subsp. massiliense]|uniref:phosphoribosyltransferase-like protein n=1 Tax=Mycobacteroides abscessus TaxID=36809 RepID=UPI0009A6D340|nr:HD domain-containing protein [Mycobacteroides abscessus]SKU60244.1 Uncharacterised protein [Mycobacteroides abscessus subsp. massiliense]
MGAPDAIVEKYVEAIAQYTNTALGDYLSELAKRGDRSTRGNSKEFNDPVWGTIVLEPQEVTVLDSPLLQRLRRIRQLGVAHLVYPGAVHTRLEHSIGVCHQVNRLIESINLHQVDSERNDSNSQVLNGRTRRLLRLTGLCHDIGHGLMSHVVENALKNDSECQQLLLNFKKHLGKDGRLQLSEIAAHCMVQTDSFKKLLSEAYRLAGLPPDPALAEHMANLIVGKYAETSMPLLHELITGPFDADKIDYMPRDATMCGVPIVTDIDRLIQKVRAVQVPEERLPDQLGHIDKTGAPQAMFTIVGLAPSGASTLDEVSLGRSLMFDKIYRHHKVRAAEAMVAAIIDQIGHLIEANPTILPLRIFDDEMLALTSERIKSADPADAGRIQIGLDIAGRLSRRDLFVRAIAFSQHLPHDPYRGRPDHRKAIAEMCRHTNEPAGRLKFVNKLAELVKQIAPLLDPPVNLGPYTENIAAYIWVDPPASSILDTKPDTNHAYLIDHDGQPQLVAEINPQARGWSDAYVNTRDMGYVFTVRELAPVVHIAAEIAARVLYGARIDGQARVHSKQQPDTLQPLRKHLAAQGFYDQFPLDMRPLPEVLERVDATRRLAKVVANLHGYQPLESTADGQLGQHAFRDAHIADWVRQFRPEFAEAALRTTESIALIGPHDINETLDTFFQRQQDNTFIGAYIVPLGGAADSSAIVAYYSRSGAKHHGCRLATLAEALMESSPIIFVDDFVGRGSTAITYFEGLLGQPDTQNLSQSRPRALEPSIAERLRSRPIALAFSAGLIGAEEAVRSRLSELGLNIRGPHINRAQPSLPTVKTALKHTESSLFTEECRRIGRQLLADTGHDEGWIRDRSLGYGNHGLLVVFPYNTPTATLTALWKAGIVDGQPWRPLIPRLKKT